MPNILDGSLGNALSILNAGRNFANGIGLSARARLLNEGFFKATRTGYNALFGFATGPGVTVEGAQTQIKGLRASLPASRISSSLLEDNGAAAASENGQTVDTEA